MTARERIAGYEEDVERCDVAGLAPPGIACALVRKSSQSYVSGSARTTALGGLGKLQKFPLKIGSRFM